MIFTIFLLIVSIIITLDSVGSKRLRARVIRQGKLLFAEAETTRPLVIDKVLPDALVKYQAYACAKKEASGNVRMRYKAAVRKKERKNWRPIEAKLFATSQPAGSLYYEDRTLSFLVSQKRFWQLSDNRIEQDQRLFSLLPQGTAPELLIKMHHIGMQAWQPATWSTSEWEWAQEKSFLLTTTSDKTIEIRLKIDAETGQLKSCHCNAEELGLALRYEYTQYEEQNGYRVPMAFTMEEKFANKTYQYEAQVTELVYDEDFAWW